MSPSSALQRLQARLPQDPRWFQIAFLGTFLAAGLAQEIVPWWEPLTVLPVALGIQALGLRLTGARERGVLSAFITGLGCSLLIRSDLPWLPAACAAVGVGSKFVVRFRGKHVFNPANLALAGGMLATPHVWASPSQWGESTVLLFWFLGLGLMVVYRALRSDVAFAFLFAHVLLKAGRVLWLGQRLAVLEHQLAVGSLIVFAFFMISDPRTTPDSRPARIGFAFAVAALAFVLQHQFWIMNGPVWALFALSPLVPLIDRVSRATPYAWPGFSNPTLSPARS